MTRPMNRVEIMAHIAAGQCFRITNNEGDFLEFDGQQKLVLHVNGMWRRTTHAKTKPEIVWKILDKYEREWRFDEAPFPVSLPIVELNLNFVAQDTTLLVGGRVLLLTPPLDEAYWLMRVKVSDDQAIVCFPKFNTYGIGFQNEEADWNTNLPYTCDACEIYNHIACNKGDDAISAELCLLAIEALQLAIAQFTLHRQS